MSELAKLPNAPMFEYEIHELANLLPRMSDNEFATFKADIAKSGIKEAIWLFEGKIIDGRHRYRAGRETGYKFSAKDFRVFEGKYAEAEAFVFSTNFLRRHLSNAQKQSIIKTMIEKYPGDSNRQIARKCGLTSHSVVAAVRDRMLNPPERKQLTDFCKTWDALPDNHRVEFVREFAADIREILAS